jgi:hypothetical protein
MMRGGLQMIQMSQDDPAERTEVLWCPPVVRSSDEAASSSSRGGGGGSMMSRALQKLLGRHSSKRRAAADPSHDMLDQFMSSPGSQAHKLTPSTTMPPPPPQLKVRSARAGCWGEAVGVLSTTARVPGVCWCLPDCVMCHVPWTL